MILCRNSHSSLSVNEWVPLHCQHWGQKWHECQWFCGVSQADRTSPDDSVAGCGVGRRRQESSGDRVQAAAPGIPGRPRPWCFGFLPARFCVSDGLDDLQAVRWPPGLASILYLWEIRTLMPKGLMNLPEVSGSRAGSRIQFSGSKSPGLSSSLVIISGWSEAVYMILVKC